MDRFCDGCRKKFISNEKQGQWWTFGGYGKKKVIGFYCSRCSDKIYAEEKEL